MLPARQRREVNNACARTSGQAWQSHGRSTATMTEDQRLLEAPREPISCKRNCTGRNQEVVHNTAQLPTNIIHTNSTPEYLPMSTVCHVRSKHICVGASRTATNACAHELDAQIPSCNERLRRIRHCSGGLGGFSDRREESGWCTFLPITDGQRMGAQPLEPQDGHLVMAFHAQDILDRSVFAACRTRLIRAKTPSVLIRQRGFRHESKTWTLANVHEVKTKVDALARAHEDHGTMFNGQWVPLITQFKGLFASNLEDTAASTILLETFEEKLPHGCIKAEELAQELLGPPSLGPCSVCAQLDPLAPRASMSCENMVVCRSGYCNPPKC